MGSREPYSHQVTGWKKTLLLHNSACIIGRKSRSLPQPPPQAPGRHLVQRGPARPPAAPPDSAPAAPEEPRPPVRRRHCGTGGRRRGRGRGSGWGRGPGWGRGAAVAAWGAPRARTAPVPSCAPRPPGKGAAAPALPPQRPPSRALRFFQGSKGKTTATEKKEARGHFSQPGPGEVACFLRG